MMNIGAVEVNRVRNTWGGKGPWFQAGDIVKLGKWYGTLESVWIVEGYRGSSIALVVIRVTHTADGRRFRKPFSRTYNVSYCSHASSIPERSSVFMA